jgi:glycosyltransferase involved in cell wall biosynthesis
VIPNGVRTRDLPARGISGNAGRSILDGVVPPGVPVIGTIGRLRGQKAHDVLIEAFARIRDRTAAHLLVIGDGVLRENLLQQTREAGLEDRVHFLGVRTDLPDLYATMSVYAHPAYFEGMPNAVMEAMAAGVPVVATAVDGTRELIRDGETGWLVPAGDAAALAERLALVLGDPGTADAVGSSGAAFVRENFSVERMVAAFESVYRPHQRER